MHVAPDLKQRLARFRQVQMPFHSDGLSVREKKMIAKLVDASRYLDDIYWRQVDPEGLGLYQTLEGSTNPQDVELRRYLWINGSRFDLLNGEEPFVGTSPISRCRGFYPQGITREQIEEYVKSHPEKRAEIYSTTTVVRWHDKELEGLPYHIAYRSFLEPAARDLREAADLSSDKGFANYLRLRADALLNGDYFKSDIVWLELKSPKFDVIFAPYETYADTLLGVKATYGASLLVRNEDESRRMETFQKYVADIQDALPVPERDRPSKRGLETPMEVMDVPFRSGDLGHGYQAVADNLPNDPRVHEQKGSKKLFFKNFMDARVNYVILPLARYMMLASQAEKASGEGSQSGCRGDVQPQMACRSRRSTQRKIAGILRFLYCGKFSNCSLRRCGSPRPSGDDGIELLPGAWRFAKRSFRQVFGGLRENAWSHRGTCQGTADHGSNRRSRRSRSVVQEI